MIVGFSGETEADFEETLSLTRAVRYHSMFSFKVLAAPEHAGAEAPSRRCRRGGEDAADCCAADVAERDTRGDLRSGRREGIRRARRCAQPAPGLGAVRTHEREHRGELRRRPDVDRASRERAHHGGESQQPSRHHRRRSLTARVGGLAFGQHCGAGHLESGAFAMQIEMTIRGLMVDPITNMPIIILRDKDGQRVLPSGSACTRRTPLRCRWRTSPRPVR